MFPYLDLFGLKVPMYGLLMAAGFLLSSVWSYRRTRKRGKEGENLIIIAAMIFGLAMVGGLLLYDIVTYTPQEWGEFIRTGHLEYLFKGGIVFYGALIGGVIGGILGSIIAKDDIRDYLDIIVPTVPVGHALGRIGCLCAGCCYGRPTDSILGVVYHNSIGGAPNGVSLFPIQLFEAGADIVIAIILLNISRKTKSRYLTTFIYCISYGLVRFVLEFFRYDSIRGIAGGLSTSQWISIVIIVLASITGIVMTIRKNKLKQQ